MNCSKLGQNILQNSSEDQKKIKVINLDSFESDNSSSFNYNSFIPPNVCYGLTPLFTDISSRLLYSGILGFSPQLLWWRPCL